jgi:hypothetical protein
MLSSQIHAPWPVMFFGTSRDLDLVMIRFEQMVYFHFEPFPRMPCWPSYRMGSIPHHLHHEHEVSTCYIKRAYQKNRSHGAIAHVLSNHALKPITDKTQPVVDDCSILCFQEGCFKCFMGLCPDENVFYRGTLNLSLRLGGTVILAGETLRLLLISFHETNGSSMCPVSHEMRS